MRTLNSPHFLFIMFYIRDFLAKHIFNGYIDLDQYESEDYRFQDRDQIIDYKYAYYTIKKCIGQYSWEYELYDQKCTIGKYLKKAYSRLTPAQITHICEKIKSILSNTGCFQIIEGSDIAKAYFRANYVPSHGTLNNSCMRYLKCQKNNYFQIYKDNVKMLIMTPKRGKRILGRAILWPYNGSYLMDRVYTTENFIEHKFYEYAKSMKWGCLNKNTYVGYGKVQQWLLPEDNYENPKELYIEIPLKNNYSNFPYMDSFCYMSTKDSSILRTYPVSNSINYILHSTKGGKSILWQI